MCLLAGVILFTFSKALKNKGFSIYSEELSQWIIQCGIRISLSSESTSVYFSLGYLNYFGSIKVIS